MINQPENTAKKVALITGSASGLGAVIAYKLGLSGYSVIINYRESMGKGPGIPDTPFLSWGFCDCHKS